MTEREQQKNCDKRISSFFWRHLNHPSLIMSHSVFFAFPKYDDSSTTVSKTGKLWTDYIQRQSSDIFHFKLRATNEKNGQLRRRTKQHGRHNKNNAEKPILHRQTYFLPNSTEIRICLAKSGDGDDKHLFCSMQKQKIFATAIFPIASSLL